MLPIFPRTANKMNPAYISALSALLGSVIGAFASLATTWLTQRHQDEARQHVQEVARRERLFVEFIDLSCKAFVDALQRTAIDPSQIIPLYATMGKLRLFASTRTVEAAEQVMQRTWKPTTLRNLISKSVRTSMRNRTSFASSLKPVAPSFAVTATD